ncbi:MAG: GNAT family N-acetyltransferase [Kouleothrix sp.]
MQQDVDVIHNAAASRFEATIDGLVSVAEYRRSGAQMIFTHTEVPPQLQGRGIAAELAHAALEYASAEQLQVVPLCWYIAQYIHRHPEYAALVQAKP